MLLLILSAVGRPAEVSPAVQRILAGDPARDVLSRRCVEVRARHRVAIPFEQVRSLLARPDALLHLLNAYAAEFPGSGDMSAMTALGDAGTFRYLNENGDPTEVRELHRGAGEGGSVELVLFSQGNRSFGRFRAVIRVVARPDASGTAYDVEVHAYPEHALLRFVARDLGFGQRYFRSKTSELCRLAERVVPAAARSASEQVALAIEPR